jgi:hypothetical protein
LSAEAGLSKAGQRGAEDAPMAENRGTDRHGKPNSRWPDYVQFLTVVVVTVLFLLLAVSMSRHHFMRGELYQQSHPEDR